MSSLDTPARREFNRAPLQSLSPMDQMLFERFGRGPDQVPPYECIHQAIEAQARANPHAVAIEHEGQSITYRQLDEQATRLAAVLAGHGIGPGDAVGLFVQRSIPMVAGILATLKTGAAYVPQDARIAPAQQLRHVIQTAGTRVILTLSHLRAKIPVPQEHVCINIDALMKEPYDAWDLVRPEPEGQCSDACFILFTSGTTGMPNGVRVTHANVCNILLTSPGDLGMRPGLKVSQLLNIAFDMAAWEILGALSHGCTLVIRGKSMEEAAAQADVIIATPSILSTIDPARCPRVKTVAVAGEPCPRPLADKWARVCRFYNSCGPTEVTIVNTMQEYKPGTELLTIGKPTPNNTVYILSEDLRPLPIGEIGEMWAGGDCVSSGYINNADLNEERYKPDPFLGGGRMMFRTRDLGRWTPNGELEHFGRTDDQVKIKGFRVELDSVSAALESVEECKQAVTLKLDSQTLVAFVRPASVDLSAAKKAVENALPYYCTPSKILALDEFPVTSRGKVDKRALTVMAVEGPQA